MNRIVIFRIDPYLYRNPPSIDCTSSSMTSSPSPFIFFPIFSRTQFISSLASPDSGPRDSEELTSQVGYWWPPPGFLVLGRNCLDGVMSGTWCSGGGKASSIEVARISIAGCSFGSLRVLSFSSVPISLTTPSLFTFSHLAALALATRMNVAGHVVGSPFSQREQFHGGCYKSSRPKVPPSG